jgi:CMP/dCMP kinase
LIASPEERANRRFREMQARGSDLTYQEILTTMLQRDQIDSTRALSPLKAAQDAVILDTDHLHIEDVLVEIRSLIFRLA